jgi:hypothetical protein
MENICFIVLNVKREGLLLQVAGMSGGTKGNTNATKIHIWAFFLSYLFKNIYHSSVDKRQQHVSLPSW